MRSLPGKDIMSWTINQVKRLKLTNAIGIIIMVEFCEKKVDK